MYARNLGIVMLVDNNHCLREKGWRTAARIRVSRKDTRRMDATGQELFFDREKDGLQRVQRVQRLMLGHNPKPSVLTASETLPGLLIPAFEEYAQLFHTMFPLTLSLWTF
ncbi:BQ5605_C008g04938 [Microbotryum silenes-dioicae]|uniref:BQ5605_C008g04938 protein n=1 Tax=Microbotryum silenes-dioicae TaxID=796604 RepID=A0A2X0PDW3_9BASI|nr:BQ5605_C008g04938 [Microbotryum silenes-dioicae]